MVTEKVATLLERHWCSCRIGGKIDQVNRRSARDVLEIRKLTIRVF